MGNAQGKKDSTPAAAPARDKSNAGVLPRPMGKNRQRLERMREERKKYEKKKHPLWEKNKLKKSKRSKFLQGHTSIL